jgi:hypothetical protein
MPASVLNTVEEDREKTASVCRFVAAKPIVTKGRRHPHGFFLWEHAVHEVNCLPRVHIVGIVGRCLGQTCLRGYEYRTAGLVFEALLDGSRGLYAKTLSER